MWIETRDLQAVKAANTSGASQAALDQLHKALTDGRITGYGSVDAGRTGALDAAEWSEYVLEPQRQFIAGLSRMGSRGNWFVRVRSTRPYRAEALKDHSYRSSIIVPSAMNPGGEVGFHRVVHAVKLRASDVKQLWPLRAQTQASPSDLADAAVEAKQRIAALFTKSPHRKTIEKGVLWQQYSTGRRRIDHLTERAFNRIWDEERKKLPSDSPWRKRGPISKRLKRSG